MRGRLPGRTALVVLAVLAIASCDAVGLRSAAYPDACDDFGFSQRRCDFIVGEGKTTLGLEDHEIAGIRLHPVPVGEQANLGGGQIALVEFDLADGGRATHEVWCVGVSFSPRCVEDASIPVAAGLDRDVPCTGEPPAGCATLPPSPPADAIAAARPLEIAALDVPIDHTGRYEIELGPAALPNGYLSERSMEIVDPRPTEYWIDAVRLEVRPDNPARPPVGSIYREPFDGPEPVTVVVSFDVTHLVEPGVLELRNIVVR